MGKNLPVRGDRAHAKPGKEWVKRTRRPASRSAQEPEPLEPPLLDRQRDPTGDEAPAIAIAVGCSFEGLLTFQGETRVDGQLVGEVIAQGTLRLGETARVRARIEVDELIVEGELVGDVLARRRIELLPTARVKGSIAAPRLSLAEGSVFEGHCRCLT